MHRIAAEEVSKTSPDLLSDRVDLLADLFPDAVTEGKVDWIKLRQALGEDIEEGTERYSFDWAGKRDALRLLQVPSRATLKPNAARSINFGEAQHVLIEGDNLEVLKLLYKAYFGRVKMIYIDPPYNTGNDFVYRDNYSDPLQSYLQISGQANEEGVLLTSNPETSGRYHSAWLSMMYPRLFVARQLLRDDGVIFVSIDDHEIFNLRMLMNEIFGEENYIETFIWKKSYGGGAKEKFAVTQHEYVLLYARNLQFADELWLPPDPEMEKRYYKYKDDKFEKRGPYRIKPLEATKSMDRRENLVYAIPLPEGGDVWPKKQWWWSKERALAALANDELVFTESKDGWSVSYKQYLRDEEGQERGAKPFSIIDGIYTQQGTQDILELFGELVFQFPKPVALIKKLLSMATTPDGDDLVLDFFAGSGPLTQAVLELNSEDGGRRRSVLVQLQERLESDKTLDHGTKLETITDIASERIKRAIAKVREAQASRLDLHGRAGQTNLDGRVEDPGIGLRFFELSESHYKRWGGVEEREPTSYAEQMAAFADPLIEGWAPEGVVWEVAVKEGFALTSVLEAFESGGRDYWRVTDLGKDQSFIICLDEKLDASVIEALSLGKEDVFVCRDDALTDELAANLALQCHLKTI